MLNLNMNVGVTLLLIVIFGYVSNWFNWRYLNYKITHLLYYVGALVHETSHALLCIITGAKIEEFKVFSSQPHVTHRKSKLPLLGELCISFAPVLGGLLFLFLINRYLLHGYFALGEFSGLQSLENILSVSARFLSQLNPLEWQSWVMVLLFLNTGAMIGPSLQDVKNIWPFLVIFFFVHSTFLVNIGLVAISLITINIVIQLILILTAKIARMVTG